MLAQTNIAPVKSAILIIYDWFNYLIICYLFADAAYLHYWLSATILFNRYNLCFDKYTECRDKCKPLYFIALHIRVVPPLSSPFMECPLSVSMYWLIGHFRRCVTERLLNAKIVAFLGFLWVAVGILFLEGTALSFRIALLAQECCYFIVNVSLGGEYTFCSHDS